MSSSLSSRFSSLSSTSNKSYNPPKPTFHSPQLQSAARHSSLLSHSVSASTADPAIDVRPRTAPNRDSSRPSALKNSLTEFGLLDDEDRGSDTAASPASVHASTHSRSSWLQDDLRESHHPEPKFASRSRSSTVGSHHAAAPHPSLLAETLHTPNPIRSQFDDSDDEEKLDVSARLSSVPQKARLAAIGTASRLFKARRHGRTASSGHSIQLSSEARSSASSQLLVHRPTTSDGLSPTPRKAVFGDRPLPDELDSKPSPARSSNVIPLELDLVKSLKASPLKSRNKSNDKHERHKAVSKPPDQRISLLRRRSSKRSTTAVDSDPHLAPFDPPPHYAVEATDEGRAGSLRKSRSLATLHPPTGQTANHLARITEDDPSRSSLHPSRGSQPASGPPEAKSIRDQRLLASVDQRRPLPGVSAISEVVSNRPKRTLSQVLPPQKPPPKVDLPPIPCRPLDNTKPTLASARKSFEMSLGGSGTEHRLEAPPPSSPSTADIDESLTLTTWSILDAYDYASPLPLTTPMSGAAWVIPPATQSTSLGSRAAGEDARLELNVGGVRLVTFKSTLHGAVGDRPRLLQCWRQDSTMALCQSTQLSRQKRVEVQRTAPDYEVADLASPPFELGSAADADASIAQQLVSRLDDILSPDAASTLDAVASSSVTSSPSTSASDLASHADSTSTRRTSGLSDAPNHEEAKPPELTAVGGAVFLDRNPEVYPDILDILRTGRLPFRLQAASVSPPRGVDAEKAGVTCRDNAHCPLVSLKLGLRCRLHEAKAEASWLGYASIVELCDRELELL